jgi:hypothetical protein
MQMTLSQRITTPFHGIGRGLRSLLSAVANRLRLAVTVQVDDSPGWGVLSDRPHERSFGEIQELYQDTIDAWRKNPLAKRAVDITADYVIGDGISLSSSHRPLQRYIDAFWSHRKNHMDNRLEVMCNELTLAGDLFPVLFTNPFDGLSYVRFVPKDRIARIETAPNDWESERRFVELPRWRGIMAGEEPGPDRPGDTTESGEDDGRQPVLWHGPEHPRATDPETPVMLHYSVNRPLGVLMGEGDLATMIPWLLRYSRMLEDRVRLHAAVRSFLWFVTVDSNKVEAKQSEYATPPEAGSIIVKDDGEEWDVMTPSLRGADAEHDLEAVRRMIYTGSSFPPHWYGERGSNRAEAAAMQAPAERHLLRRQRYFVFVLQDLLYHGYRRVQAAVPSLPALGTQNYQRLFAPAVPDISREDNQELAHAAERLTNVYKQLVLEQEPRSRTLTKSLLTQIFRFMGEPQESTTIAKITDEIFSNLDHGPRPAASPARQPSPNGASR